MYKWKKMLKFGFQIPVNKKIRNKKAKQLGGFYSECLYNFQRLKAHYHHLNTAYFKKIALLAMKIAGKETDLDPKEVFVSLLESRMDSFIHNCGLAKTHAHASQMVSHKHVTINGKKVSIRSIILKPGDIVKVIKHEKNSEEIKLPEYSKFDENGLGIIFLRYPKFSEISFKVEVDLNKVFSYLI